MNKTEVQKLFDKINVWKRGGERAPHKPLLVLYALGRCLRGEDRLTSYQDVDRDVRKLLVEFGPSRKSFHPEFPFWYLQNDHLWELPGFHVRSKATSKEQPAKGELLKKGVKGGFPEPVFSFLSKNKKAIGEIARKILSRNFPESSHEDILAAVGLDVAYEQVGRRKRNPEFRARIIRAYEYKCAVCGYDVQMENAFVGLEAAHIKWHQAYGPDTEDNGLALCSMHHKVFDRGAFTLTPNLRLLVSQRVHGSSGLQEWLLRFHDKPLRMPQSPDFCPKREYVDWHRSEVFRHPPRYTQEIGESPLGRVAEDGQDM